MSANLQHTFWRNHLIFPLISLIGATFIIEIFNIDMLFADFLYTLEGGSWALKDAWVTSTLIHKTGKYLSMFIALILAIALTQSYFTSLLRGYRRELLYLLIAAAGGSALISIIKEYSHISCAWDFMRYGGTKPYENAFSELRHLSGGQCFPAGHASGGYAWVAFYFLGTFKKSPWRWAGLGFALSVGLIFGISQQLRGAHFISHDLWSIGICWFFSLITLKLMLIKKL
jgi:membrane-associated PAP2 superfamily phosphatase